MWLWIFTGLNIIMNVHGYASGGVLVACGSMVPQHYSFKPDERTPPFHISYQEGNEEGSFIVFLQGNNSNVFRGFMLEAREEGGPSVGYFTPIDPKKTQLLDCNGVKASAVSHRNNGDKASFKVQWTAPVTRLSNNISFRATFVQYLSTFWVNVATPLIPPSIPSTTATTISTTTTAMTTTPPPTTPLIPPSIPSTTATTISTTTTAMTTTPPPTTPLIPPSIPSTTATTISTTTTAMTTTPPPTTPLIPPSIPSTTATTISTTTNAMTTTPPPTTPLIPPSIPSTTATTISTTTNAMTTTPPPTPPLITLSISNTIVATTTNAMRNFQPLPYDIPVPKVMSSCFMVMKEAMANMITTCVNKSISCRHLNRMSKIIFCMLCLAMEIISMVLLIVYASSQVTLIALLSVVIILNVLEIVLVFLPNGPSHELKYICNSVTSVCSVIHLIFTIAFIYVCYSEMDMKHPEPLLIAYTVWIFLFNFWVLVVTILQCRKKGSSENRMQHSQQKREKMLHKAGMIVPAVFIIVSIALAIAVIVRILQ